MRYLKYALALIFVLLSHFIFEAVYEVARPKGVDIIAASDIRIEQQAIENQAIRAVSAKNFAALEDQYNRHKTALFADGTNKLAHFYYGVDRAMSMDKEWARMEELCREWQNLYPESIAAKLSLARLHYLHATDIRDGKFMNALTTENRNGFLFYMAKAAEALDKVSGIAANDPVWHSTNVNIIGQRHGAGAELQQAVAAGAKAYPNYIPLYMATLNYLQPKWGGSVDAIEQFANWAATTANPEAGDALYARIYASLTKPTNPYRYNIFTATHANWPRIRTGFEAIVAKWPDPVTHNLFALLACTQGDREAAASQLRIIGDQPLDEVWDKPIVRFIRCKSWAAIEQVKELDVPIPGPIGSFDYNLQSVAKLFHQRDWKALEEWHADFFNNDTRYHDGAAKLDTYYLALTSVTSSNMIGGPTYWVNLHTALDDWQKAYPASYLPKLMHASVYFNEGHLILGNNDMSGLTKAITPEAKANIDALVDKARVALEGAPEQAKQSPFWYAIMLNVARSQNWPTRKMEELVLEGVKQRPQSDFFMQAVDVLQERQGKGMAAFVEQVARASENASPADETSMTYARIYAWAYRRYFHDRLFSNSEVKWADLRTGFNSLLDKYPSAWNRNVFADLACLARDPNTAAYQLKLARRPNLEAWQGGLTSYDACMRLIAE